MAGTDHPPPIVISDEQARGGVIGHNVRYVLAFGLTGIIAVFAAFALYEGYDALAEHLTAALSQNPSEFVQGFAPYAALVIAAAIAIGLLLGVWSLLAGPTDDGSQAFMRFRVVAQFVAIGVILGIYAMSQSG